MQIALALYPGFTALDIIGPFQVLSALRGARCAFVAERRGPVLDDTGAVELHAPLGFADCPAPELIVVGGLGATHSAPSHRGVAAERLADCGVDHLGVHGLSGARRGRPASGSGGDHALAGHAVPPRPGCDPGRAPCGVRRAWGDRGRSECRDRHGPGERMHGRKAAETVQLAIEYDPQLPRDAGHPTKASPALVERGRARLSKATGLHPLSGRPARIRHRRTVASRSGGERA